MCMHRNWGSISTRPRLTRGHPLPTCAEQNKKCNKNKMSQVKLNLDATGHSKKGGESHAIAYIFNI